MGITRSEDYFFEVRSGKKIFWNLETGSEEPGVRDVETPCINSGRRIRIFQPCMSAAVRIDHGNMPNKKM